MHRHRQIGGFTLLEVVISTGILSMLMLAAATSSQITMTAANSVTKVESSTGNASHFAERLRSYLVPASRSRLEAVPAGVNKVAETMLSGVSYDNIRFRTVTGFRNGAVVLTPAVGTNPWRIYRSVDARGTGSLWHDNGTRQTKLLDDVASASFTLTGKHLYVSLVSSCPDAAGDTTTTFEIALLVP